MLNYQEIQKMIIEMRWDQLANTPRFSELGYLSKFTSQTSSNQWRTFIEITTNTNIIDPEQGKQHGELGRNPQ